MVEATLAVPPDGSKSEPYTALVDTGAQATMISSKIAKALGATSVGKRNIVCAYLWDGWWFLSLDGTTVTQWRSVVDVDIVGFVDPPDKVTTDVRYLRCGR